MSHKATKQEIIDHFELYIEASTTAFDNLPNHFKRQMLDSINEQLNDLDQKLSSGLVTTNYELYDQLSQKRTALFKYAVKLSDQFRMNENKNYVFNHVSYHGHQRVTQFDE